LAFIRDRLPTSQLASLRSPTPVPTFASGTSFQRFSEFPAYETQMKAIFHDVFIYDVAWDVHCAQFPLLEKIKLLLTGEEYMMSATSKLIQLLFEPSPLKIPAL
jgi:hypothetical protein